MRRSLLPLFALAVALGLPACTMIEGDPGPEMTHEDGADAGTAEAVRADVRMGAGELEIKGGASKLLDASFRYSERLGRPSVRYELTGFRGRLTVENPNKVNGSGNIKNEWKLTFGGKIPIDLHTQLGAGEAKLDLSQLPIRNVEIQMGAGELELNVAGNYQRDIDVKVQGGVGEAKIKLPRDFGAEVEAHGGIGSINVDGLRKRNGKYYNDAFAEGKPAVRMRVHGGIGEINLSVN
jgi:hypothetical protein